MDCSLPGSSVHGILQARIREWVAMPFSRRSFQPRDGTHVSYVSCIGRQSLYHQHHLGSPLLHYKPSENIVFLTATTYYLSFFCELIRQFRVLVRVLRWPECPKGPHSHPNWELSNGCWSMSSFSSMRTLHVASWASSQLTAWQLDPRKITPRHESRSCKFLKTQPWKL